MGCIDSGGESPAVRGPDCGPVRGARRRGEFVRLWVCVTVFSICKSICEVWGRVLVFPGLVFRVSKVCHKMPKKSDHLFQLVFHRTGTG